MSYRSREETEQLAMSVFTGADVVQAADAGHTPAQHLREQLGVNVHDYEEEDALREAVRDAREDRVEHLSAPSPRGSSSPGQRSDPDVEQLAKSVMTGTDVVQAAEEGRTPVEHLREAYDVDAGAFGDETELREAVREARR